MFIYNVTSQLPAVLEAEWVQWMNEEHIPMLMALGCFAGAALNKLIEVQGEQTEDDMVTYAAQYFFESRQRYDEYIGLHSEVMRMHAKQAFGEQVTSFRTLLRQVHKA